MNLSNQYIAKAVEDIQTFFEQEKVSQRERLKIQLIVEEALLRWQEHFGTEKDFEVQTSSWFGTPKVSIRIDGDEFNPLKHPKDKLAIFSEEVMQNLLTYEEARITYDYKNGCNELAFSSAKERKPIKIPGGSTTIAILIAFVATFIVGQFPQNVQSFIVDNLTTPLLSILMKLIVAVTIPTIFISVVSSMFIMENVATLNDIGLRVIRRFIFIMLMVIAVSMCVCSLFFPLVSTADKGHTLSGQIIELLLSIIPTSLFTPFIDGNVLQIVIIAFITGVCIIILSKNLMNLKLLINDIKILLFKMTELILKIIPLTIFLSIFKTGMAASLSALSDVWKIVAASYITYIVVTLAMFTYLKAKYNLNITEFFRQNAQTFIVSITTASGTAAMIANYDVCKKNMKIDPNLCDFWIPLSHTLFSPGTVNTLVTCAFMGAMISNDLLSVTELLIIAFLAIQLSIVAPKVYGGSVAGFTILLTQLNLSMETIGVMMIAEIFTANLSGAFGMVIRNGELFDLSHQVKFSKAQS